jgi:hypothetical protein
MGLPRDLLESVGLSPVYLSLRIPLGLALCLLLKAGYPKSVDERMFRILVPTDEQDALHPCRAIGPRMDVGDSDDITSLQVLRHRHDRRRMRLATPFKVVLARPRSKEQPFPLPLSSNQRLPVSPQPQLRQLASVGLSLSRPTYSS